MARFDPAAVRHVRVRVRDRGVEILQTKDGVTTYFHYALAAKIVTPIGLVVPLAFEFVENPAESFDNGQFSRWNGIIRFARIRPGTIRRRASGIDATHRGGSCRNDQGSN